VKVENGDLLANSNILSRWKNYFSHSLNARRVSDVRQGEIHTAEPLVADPNPFEFKIAVEKLKRYKSPGSNKIPLMIKSFAFFKYWRGNGSTMRQYISYS
jgi:hypothetical protein